MYRHINISNIDTWNVQFSEAVPYNANDLPSHWNARQRSSSINNFSECSFSSCHISMTIKMEAYRQPHKTKVK